MVRVVDPFKQKNKVLDTGRRSRAGPAPTPRLYEDALSAGITNGINGLDPCIPRFDRLTPPRPSVLPVLDPPYGGNSGGRYYVWADEFFCENLDPLHL